jgi:hypothetical protein
MRALVKLILPMLTAIRKTGPSLNLLLGRLTVSGKPNLAHDAGGRGAAALALWCACLDIRAAKTKLVSDAELRGVGQTT